MSDPGIVETADPGTVFKALSDGTRVDILLALWDAEDHTATFSTLHDAVGVRDSGQFNYHLDKLRDRFVRKTDDGYTLTLAGKQIVGAIQTGTYTMEGSIEPIDLDDPCRACGGDRTLYYEDETVRVECADCPVTAQSGVPPGVFAGYERAAIPAVTGRYFATIREHYANGFCWSCDGQVTPTVDAVDEEITDSGEPMPEQFQSLPYVKYECDRCGATLTSDLGAALLSHSAVVAFFYDHGIDVRERPFWEYSAVSTDQSRLRQHDPLRATMTYSVDDASLTVVVDEDFSVVDVTRSDT